MRPVRRCAVLVVAAALVAAPAGVATACPLDRSGLGVAGADPLAALQSAIGDVVDEVTGSLPLPVDASPDSPAEPLEQGAGDGQAESAAPATSPADDAPSLAVHGGLEAIDSALCLRAASPTGGVAQVELVVFGEAVLERVLQEAPELRELLSPCPDAGEVVRNGLVVIADGGGLGRLCLRLDADAAQQLALDLVAAGTDVLATLTGAGLPLRDSIPSCEGDSDDAGTPPEPDRPGADPAADRDPAQVAASRVPAAGASRDRLPHTGGPLAVTALFGAAATAAGVALYRLTRRPSEGR
jgi:hypothetical protein